MQQAELESEVGGGRVSTDEEGAAADRGRRRRAKLRVSRLIQAYREESLVASAWRQRQRQHSHSSQRGGVLSQGAAWHVRHHGKCAPRWRAPPSAIRLLDGRSPGAFAHRVRRGRRGRGLGEACAAGRGCARMREAHDSGAQQGGGSGLPSPAPAPGPSARRSADDMR